MQVYLFTFGFTGAAKLLNDSGGEEPFASVYAPNHEKAVKKILKLKLPFVENEQSLLFNSVQE